MLLVALLHVYFLVLEMFLWDKPFGRRTFGMTPEHAAATKTLAMNQGLYNGFLAAGLLWSLAAGAQVTVFFLVCVIVAGVFGAATASRKILWVQAVPGLLALVARATAARAAARAVSASSSAESLQDPGIVEAPADHLHADRQAFAAVGPVDRRRRLLGHVVGHGEGDVRQRVARVVARRGKLGLVGKDRRSRRQDEVVGLARGHRGFAHRHDLRVRLHHVAAREVRARASCTTRRRTAAPSRASPAGAA